MVLKILKVDPCPEPHAGPVGWAAEIHPSEAFLLSLMKWDENIV